MQRYYHTNFYGDYLGKVKKIYILFYLGKYILYIKKRV